MFLLYPLFRPRECHVVKCHVSLCQMSDVTFQMSPISLLVRCHVSLCAYFGLGECTWGSKLASCPWECIAVQFQKQQSVVPSWRHNCFLTWFSEQQSVFILYKASAKRPEKRNQGKPSAYLPFCSRHPIRARKWNGKQLKSEKKNRYLCSQEGLFPPLGCQFPGTAPMAGVGTRRQH